MDDRFRNAGLLAVLVKQIRAALQFIRHILLGPDDPRHQEGFHILPITGWIIFRVWIGQFIANGRYRPAVDGSLTDGASGDVGHAGDEGVDDLPLVNFCSKIQ